MKKVKGLNQLLVVGFAATVISFGAAGFVSAECVDAESMMSEGITYGCEQGIKTINDLSDLRLDREAMMAEGIPYSDSIIASNIKVINCDHKSILSAPEDCHSEGTPMASNRKTPEESKQMLVSLQSILY